ncbi:hypothetical protein SLEP1_g22367 [Rubroshorea leprosula]|uniref:Uncharacterized protein n=1 Tax=Rubroshorea leprosula TaxID=152421 RepID=A0AAV5JBY9_9ROSI|nr:hypothetical protein SLEP1_g22367 [Rubroshorea leprosula]
MAGGGDIVEFQEVCPFLDLFLYVIFSSEKVLEKGGEGEGWSLIPWVGSLRPDSDLSSSKTFAMLVFIFWGSLDVL